MSAEPRISAAKTAARIGRKSPPSFEDEAEVVADGGEDGVGVVAVQAFEVVAGEMAIGLHMANRRLDGRSALEFALDLAVHAAPLAGEVDRERLGRVVPAVSLVGVGSFDFPAGELPGFLDDFGQGMAIIWIAGQGLGVEHELAALAATVGGGDRDLDAELVGLVRLAFADALGLRRWPGDPNVGLPERPRRVAWPACPTA